MLVECHWFVFIFSSPPARRLVVQYPVIAKYLEQNTQPPHAASSADKWGNNVKRFEYQNVEKRSINDSPFIIYFTSSPSHLLVSEPALHFATSLSVLFISSPLQSLTSSPPLLEAVPQLCSSSHCHHFTSPLLHLSLLVTSPPSGLFTSLLPLLLCDVAFSQPHFLTLPPHPLTTANILKK